MAAATVPFEGRPEKAKARKSNHRTRKVSVMPAASSTADHGPSRRYARSPMRGSAIAPRYGNAVTAAPRSARNASGGTASTARCSGSMNSQRRSHCATVASPSPIRAIVAFHATGSPAMARKSPSSVYITHSSYCFQSGLSPIASNTWRNGLKEGLASPLHNDGPLSKVYPDRSNECAAPPGMLCASHTKVRLPYLLASEPAERPPMPEPMTMTSYSEASAAVVICGVCIRASLIVDRPPGIK
mmetsp:Transcript_91030/g.166870  ORF Transcript_91030/g.166870 Transcript_91030/m.166870 type:complete len:243 (-) Transcript_91030:162-890(-)